MIFKGFRFGMLLQLAVGPVCLFIFQTAASSGFLTAETGVLGVTIIDGLYILAAIYGIGTILNKYKKPKDIIKYFGAFVLILFGLSNIAGVYGISLIPSLNFLSKQSIQGVFLKTLILTLSNPLTIIFWAGVFSTKIAEETMNQKDLYLFGSGAVLSTLFFLSIIAILGSFINTFLNPAILNVLNILVGLVLIGFGIKTAAKKL